MLRRNALIPVVCLALALSAGCSGKKDETPPVPAGTLISVTAARTQDVPVLLKSIGRLESRYYAMVAEIDRTDPGARGLAKPAAVTYATSASAPAVTLR